jgi:hypothetical protein
MYSSMTTFDVMGDNGKRGGGGGQWQWGELQCAAI